MFLSLLPTDFDYSLGNWTPEQWDTLSDEEKRKNAEEELNSEWIRFSGGRQPIRRKRLEDIIAGKTKECPFPPFETAEYWYEVAQKLKKGHYDVQRNEKEEEG